MGWRPKGAPALMGMRLSACNVQLIAGVIGNVSLLDKMLTCNRVRGDFDSRLVSTLLRVCLLLQKFLLLDNSES